MPRLRRLRFGRNGFAISMSSLAGLKAEARVVTGIGVRKFLMKEHQWTSTSLPVLDDVMVVDKLLAGIRELTVER